MQISRKRDDKLYVTLVLHENDEKQIFVLSCWYTGHSERIGVSKNVKFSIKKYDVWIIKIGQFVSIFVQCWNVRKKNIERY